MLCLGPGPPSLLHLTRADLIWPYAGDTIVISEFGLPITLCVISKCGLQITLFLL